MNGNYSNISTNQVKKMNAHEEQKLQKECKFGLSEYVLSYFLRLTKVGMLSQNPK